MTKLSILFLAIFTGLSIICFGQSANYILRNENISARLSNSGSMFWGQLHVPANAEQTPIYISSLWLGGKTSNNDIVVAAQTYLQKDEREFKAGPVGTETNALKYDRFWVITKSLIDNHRNNYNEIGYVIDENIETWPAHGDTLNGEAWHLAPFVDLNENGIYEPILGDYPRIKGDEAVYFIYSEAAEKKFSFSENGGFEIHGMAYLYNNVSSNTVRSTLFIDYKIYNRSNNDYTDFVVGTFNDFDLGYGFDDLVACSEEKNTSFVYNGSSFDSGKGGMEVFYQFLV